MKPCVNVARWNKHPSLTWFSLLLDNFLVPKREFFFFFFFRAEYEELKEKPYERSRQKKNKTRKNKWRIHKTHFCQHIQPKDNVYKSQEPHYE